MLKTSDIQLMLLLIIIIILMIQIIIVRITTASYLLVLLAEILRACALVSSLRRKYIREDIQRSGGMMCMARTV